VPISKVLAFFLEPISKVLAFFVNFYFSCALNLFYGTRIDFLLKKV